MADDWLSTGASLLGAYLGSKGNDTTTTSTNAIDSRMGNYIYGNGSNVQGVLPAATDWYQKNQSGLNDQSLQGLNRQWNTASDPATAQGYTNMQGLGASLMGGGVAGNPFTSGRASLGGGSNLGLGGQAAQPQFQNPATMGNAGTASPFTQPTGQWHPQTPQAALTNWAQGPANWTGGYDGGHNGNSSGSNAPGGSSQYGGVNGNGMPGEGGGLTMHDVMSGLLANQSAVNTGASAMGGPLAGLLSRLGLLGMGYMSAGTNGDGASAPNSVGGINNYGSFNNATTNAGISAANNQNGMNGGNSSGGGGDSGRGSQSTNGGRNGGDSGGF